MAAYCEDTDINLVFGSVNVSKWADANNNANAGEIATRIAWAAQRATDHINDKLRRTYYTIPFDPPPQSIIDLAATFAGCILYQMPRGLVDGEDAQAAMQSVRDEAENTLMRIVSGQMKLDVDNIASMYPGVVNADDES